MDGNDQQILNLKSGMDMCTKTVAGKFEFLRLEKENDFTLRMFFPAVVSLNLQNSGGLEAALEELRATMKSYINQEHE